MGDGLIGFDATKIKEELTKALKSFGETDYEFRERIYDATQAASDECKEDGQIRVIRVDWDKRKIDTVGWFAELKSAYAFVEQADNADPHYIIGADIEEI